MTTEEKLEMAEAARERALCDMHKLASLIAPLDDSEKASEVKRENELRAEASHAFQIYMMALVYREQVLTRSHRA
jgi:hypothetical protein